MMSELTARILSSISAEAPVPAQAPEDKAGAMDSPGKPVRAPRKKRIPPYAKFPSGRPPCPPPPSDGGSSGYSADVEATASSGALEASNPPGSIDLDSSRQTSSKRFAIPEVKPLYKRHKPTPEEDQYNVARVFDDLSAGNIEIPMIQAGRPRIFPARSGVDLSGVRLVSARDVKDTPILSLHPAICSESSEDFHYDFSVIASLAYEVSTLYREIEKKELSNAALRSIKDVASSLQQQEQRDGASTSGSEDSATSSFTESASDGAASNDIHAGETTFFSSATQCSAETKLSEIASIGQVMALSSTPRLLVSSSSPYQILQVNAAFHRFSKAFSFLGKTASDLTTDQNLSTALAKAGSERRPFKARVEQFQWENSQPTTVSVYPVGTHKGSVITHFAVEVFAGEEAPATASTYSRPQDTQAAVPGHVVVTG